MPPDGACERQELSRVGGPAVLHELIQSVPTAANASFYAEIVAEKAVLRRLVTGLRVRLAASRRIMWRALLRIRKQHRLDLASRHSDHEYIFYFWDRPLKFGRGDRVCSSLHSSKTVGRYAAVARDIILRRPGRTDLDVWGGIKTAGRKPWEL